MSTPVSITIHSSFLPQDTLGFEVRNDVGYNGLRWITLGPTDQPATSISGPPVRL